MNIKPQLSCLTIWILGVLLDFLLFSLNPRVLQNAVVTKNTLFTVGPDSKVE